MKHIIPAVFYILLTAVLVVEGSSFPSFRVHPIQLILFAPLTLFLTALLTQKKEMVLPPQISATALLFILTVFAFTVFSTDIGRAFEHRLLYLSIFLTSLFAYNFQKELLKGFPIFLLILSFSLVVYTAVIQYLLSQGPYLAPFQFGRATSALGHDTFGSFILIPLAYLVATISQKTSKTIIAASVFLLGLLIASWLRASYIAIITVIALTHKHWIRTSKKRYLIAGCLFLFIGFVVISITPNYIPGLSNFIKEASLDTKKSTFNTRIEIAGQAWRSIKDHPVTGIGSFNYYYASLQNAETIRTIVGSSHNIILDTAVENGVPAGIFFLVSIGLLLINGKYALSNGTPTQKGIFAIFVALLVLFLLSHYHKMYFLLLFFFVAGALVYKEKQEIAVKTTWILLTAVLLAAVNIYLISARTMLQNGYPEKALSLYPIYAAGYQYAAAHAYSRGDYPKMDMFLQKYEYFYPHNPLVLEFIGGMYKSVPDYPKALEYYQKALTYSPLEFNYLYEIYNSMKEVRDPATAEIYVQRHSKKYKLIYNNYLDEDTKDFRAWCEQQKIDCADD